MTVLRSHTHTPGEPLIELQNVARRFVKKLDRSRSLQELFIRVFRRRADTLEDFWPLRDLSMTVHPGDCVGVIGPNGSGKSTLLKLITGILPPTRGNMIVRGRISSLLELGAGFQQDLTGRENIYLNGSIYGLGRAEMDKRIDPIIEYAGLGNFIDTAVKHYSSGMYVRLGFAVAIHTDPDLLLVDEVLSVGDAAFQNKCMDSIYRFRRQGGTLLLVSHDLETIQTLCTRAIWIDEGKIASEGAPRDVVMAYKKYVADEDEKQRATEQQTVGQGQRWGSGEAEITRVELCSADGAPRATFVTGEPMTIRLHYQCHRRIEQPVFGLSINHQDGSHLFGPNTQLGSLAIDSISGQGCVSYTISELSLLEGQYVLSAAIVNEPDTVTYDYHDRAYLFRVAYSPRRTGYGMVDLGGAWRQEADAVDTAPASSAASSAPSSTDAPQLTKA